jgi:hypothetical protein
MALLSAKGAAFNDSLGQRPRVSRQPKPPALKARFISSERIEARFQRFCSLGD